MINVTVHGPNARYQLDTPDATMIGPWLMALFKDYKPSRVPVDFRIEIYAS